MEQKDIKICGREQEIIESARKVFAEYGYKKVTMDDVAAELDISRSALYYYYKSKEELFAAVAGYDFRSYESELRKAVGSAQTTDDRFIAFCRCFLPMRKTFRDVYKLGNDDFFFPAAIGKKFKVMVGDIHSAVIAEIFLKDKKFVNLDNILYYATLLTYSIRGVIFSSYDNALDQLESDIITLCKIFCQGIPGAGLTVKNDSDKKG